jgi:hypothetical protein
MEPLEDPHRTGEEQLEIEADPEPAQEINMWGIPQSLDRLALFDGDPFLTMQATNIGLIDSWLTDLEGQVQRELLETERTPRQVMFLSAVTQMWLFATYELLRTWRQRAKDVLKLARNGGLKLKIDALEKDIGFAHMGRELRAAQLRKVQEDPKAVVKIENDLRRTHIVFVQLETLRVSIAKHEVSGRPNMIAFAPGYSRIHHLTGSLSYELSNGRAIVGYITRRDIADAIREIDHEGEPQSKQDLERFDQFLKGQTVDPSEPEAE